MRVKNAAGLVGEFLCEVKDHKYFEYVTWELAENAEGEYQQHIHSYNFVSFVNVGIWRSKEDFLANIGGYVPRNPWSMYPFEAAPRRRAVLEPAAWRIGEFPLPSSTSPSVLS